MAAFATSDSCPRRAPVDGPTAAWPQLGVERETRDLWAAAVAWSSALYVSTSPFIRLDRSSPRIGISITAIRTSVSPRSRVRIDLDVLVVPRHRRSDRQMLLLAVALLPLVVEAGVDVIGADEQGHHVRSAGDDRIQPLRDVVGELAVDAGVHELVAAGFPVGLQAVDVVGADLPA